MDEQSPPNTNHAPPKAGEPPLHRAARSGDHDAIRRLLGEGADLNASFDISLDPSAYPNPATPLMVAAGSGDGASAETIKLLLELGADPQVELGGRSAASFACTGLGWNYRPGGDDMRLQQLLAAGSRLPRDPSAANQLVCNVARSGDADRLRELLDAGLSAKGHFDREQARARAKRSMDAMAVYRAENPSLDFGLPPELMAEMEASMREMDLKMMGEQSSAPWGFEIPLHCAAESGSEESVRLLLERGADLVARDSMHRTAIYLAGSEGVVRTLVDAGLPLEDADKYGWSPLDAAVTDGESALPRFKALIAGGADVNASHDRGYTVFMSAVGSGRCPETLRNLVAVGADPHAVSELGYNAFHAAIDVNGEADAEGNTPLVGVIAALCSDAENYDEAFERFYAGLGELPIFKNESAETKEAFLAQAVPELRSYVEEFASNIPIDQDPGFAEDWRKERIACVALLCA